MFTFQQLNNACTNCTSFFIRKSKDDEGENIYLLFDGCGEQDGDPFEDLETLNDYITLNGDCREYLERHHA